MTIFLPSAPPSSSSQRVRALSLPSTGQSLDLTDWEANGLYINSIELGFPTTRDATVVPPLQDGSYDLTRFFGPRTVTIQGVALAGNGRSRTANLAALAPYLTPGVGPVLTVATDNDIEPCQIQLRATQFSAPLTTPGMATFQVQWVAPDPILYGLTTNETDIAALSEPTGRTYPKTYAWDYPMGSGGIGYAYVNTAGNYPVWPVFHAFGLIYDPAVELLDTDGDVLASVPFTGLTINQDDYLEIDTQERTVYLNGESGSSRYSFLDFDNLAWWQLSPGQNIVRYSAAGWAGPTAMLAVRWNDAYILPSGALT